MTLIDALEGDLMSVNIACQDTKKLLINASMLT